MGRVWLALLLIFSFFPATAPQKTSVAAEARDLPGFVRQLVLERQNETVDCETDGAEGRRVLAVYLYPDGQPNGFDSHVEDINRTLSMIDATWDEAADPYDQHPRWACDPGTSNPVVLQERGPAVGDDGSYTFDDVRSALLQESLVSPDRVYLVFADNIGQYPYGGQATVDADDHADPTNLNNVGPAYAMIDAQKASWSWRGLWGTGMHELMHALGGVQCSAPHASCPASEPGRYHCWDGTDIMCYDDGGSYYLGPDGISGTADDRSMSHECEPRTEAELIDCGRDDYFNVAPGEDSYLATHWNLTRSSFVTALLPE